LTAARSGKFKKIWTKIMLPPQEGKKATEDEMMTSPESCKGE
jgi:hypothetical protein